MRKTIALFVVLAALAIFAWSLIKQNPETKTSYDTSQSEFAIKDIDQIERIFITDKQGQTVDLTRNRSGWTLNDQYTADQNSVDLLLNGIRSLDIQYIPPRAARDNIIKTMASFGLQVEIFGKKDVRLKKFFIGGMTQDERGTYFLMDQSDQPYVMQIKGFVGNLRERFRPEINRFRSQRFLSLDRNSIKSIHVHYPRLSENDFKIERNQSRYDIVIPSDKSGKAHIGQVEAYLDRLSKLACESFLRQDPRKDSVAAEIPFCELKIEHADDRPVTRVQFWQKPTIGDESALHRLFILRDEEFMLGQYEVLKGAFRNADFFKLR